MQLISLVFKFPMRLLCYFRKGHTLQNHGGFMGIHTPKHTWSCSTCGKRSTSDYETMKKKGFAK